MKTYSVCILTKAGHWVTNWHQYASQDDIDWDKVKKHVEENGHLAYGYMYGVKSRNLTAKRCRTVLWEKKAELVKDNT